MEHTSLLFGFLFAIGAFAIKGGAGGYYYLTNQTALTPKIIFLSAYYLIYLALFAVTGLLLSHVRLMEYFTTIQSVMSWAMLFHFLLAVGLIAWGMVLLKQVKPTANPSSGWLALVIPCPVCVLSIFITLAFLRAYFPDQYLQAISVAYTVYVVIHASAMLTLYSYHAKSQSSPEKILGAVMLILAGYFFLSIFIMPHFAEVERIYRLAAYQGQASAPDTQSVVISFSLMTACFFAGVFRQIVRHGG